MRESSNSTINNTLELTRYTIEDTFGRKVLTARDCEELSGEIYLRTSQRLHSNTLRRLFGIIKTNYRPSVSTLQIIAKYCGLNSIEELRSSNENEPLTDPFADNTSILRYLHSLFLHTEVAGYTDRTFFSQMPIVIRFMNHNPGVSDTLCKLIAHTTNGQNIFYEQCINIDRLNSYYGNALPYYLAQKTTAEAQVFGHSLLCLRYWLTADHEQLEREYRKVISIPLDKSIHPFVQGRYFATQLFYADSCGAETRNIIAEAFQWYKKIKPAKRPYHLFPAFRYIFSEALVLTGHFKEALELLAARKHNKVDTEIDQALYQVFDLMEALAFSRMGRKKTALKIIKRLHPTQFHWLSRKYKTILYLLTALEVSRNTAKIHEQLQHLLQTTGFRKLEKFIEKS